MNSNQLTRSDGVSSPRCIRYAKQLSAALFLTNLSAAFSAVPVWVIEVFGIGGAMFAFVGLPALGSLLFVGAFFAWSSKYDLYLFFAISSALMFLLTLGVLDAALRSERNQRFTPWQIAHFIGIPLAIQGLNLALAAYRLVQLQKSR